MIGCMLTTVANIFPAGSLIMTVPIGLKLATCVVATRCAQTDLYSQKYIAARTPEVPVDVLLGIRDCSPGQEF